MCDENQVPVILETTWAIQDVRGSGTYGDDVLGMLAFCASRSSAAFCRYEDANHVSVVEAWWTAEGDELKYLVRVLPDALGSAARTAPYLKTPRDPEDGVRGGVSKIVFEPRARWVLQEGKWVRPEWVNTHDRIHSETVWFYPTHPAVIQARMET